MLKWFQGVLSGSEAQGAPAQTTKPLTPAAKAGSAAPESGGESSSPLIRQIVIDRNYQVSGYDFSLRGQQTRGTLSDPRSDKINDQILIRTIHSLGAEGIAQFRQLWLSIADVSLASPLLESLPAKATVIVVRQPPHGAANQEALRLAAALRERGFRLALPGYSDAANIPAWLPLVDYISFDAGFLSPDELKESIAALRQKSAGIKAIARRIASYEEFEFCHSLGFDAFSGHFLTRREAWPPQPPLPPDRVSVCAILNQLRGGGELNDIADALRHSPELSYRFLRYINSAGMGLPGNIGSIEQGVMYLGREKLYRWLTLLLFSSRAGRVTDTALLEQAMVRARMMELMGSEKLNHVQCDELFVVGMFSLLDILMRLPLQSALKPLHLPAASTDALLEGSGPYAPYLKLAIGSEAGDGEGEHSAATLAELAAALSLTTGTINAHHIEAVAWTQQLSSAAPSV